VSQLNSRIQKFTGDGIFVTGWGGSKDSSSSVADIGSQLKTPSGIAIDSSSGNVYVAD
jgi:DNA-binding beta-propeller fold protein YncE